MPSGGTWAPPPPPSRPRLQSWDPGIFQPVGAARVRRPSRDHARSLAPWRAASQQGGQRRRQPPQPQSTAVASPAPMSAADSQAYAQRLDEGLAHFEGGRLSVAISCFRACAELWPEGSTPPYNLACAHAALGELDDARQCLWRAVELGVSTPPPLLPPNSPTARPLGSFARCSAPCLITMPYVSVYTDARGLQVSLHELGDDPDLASLTSAPGFESTRRSWRRTLQASRSSLLLLLLPAPAPPLHRRVPLGTYPRHPSMAIHERWAGAVPCWGACGCGRRARLGGHLPRPRARPSPPPPPSEAAAAAACRPNSTQLLR
jgi:hypothetical protein